MISFEGSLPIIKDFLVLPLIGAGMAQALITAVELIRARGRDSLYGEWLYAVQPVYYLTRRDAPNKPPPVEDRWHVHRLQIAPSWRGLKARTIDAPGKLQWVWYPKLKREFFLTGIWRSTRKTSASVGCMSVQVSRDGRYMFGFDFGIAHAQESSNFGILLLGKSERDLQSAWTAVDRGRRRVRPLSDTIDFD
jgi:hypothetical protein